MKVNSLLSLLIIVLFIFFQVSELECARGGGSRGGSSRGGSSSSRGGSSFSSRGGGTSSSRTSSQFSFSRSTGYSYGTYSGIRYGTSIRRTIYWPVYRIGYGYPSRYNYYYNNYYNQKPTVNNLTEAPAEIRISDTYTKQNVDEGVSYQCVSSSSIVAASCFEPNGYNYTNTDITLAIDGCCCENATSSTVVCCVVELDSDLSKANTLLKIFTTLICMTITSIVLIMRICR